MMNSAFVEEEAFLDLWKRTKNKSCPHCGHEDFYLLGGMKVRCTECGKDYRPLMNTWYSLVRLSAVQWVMVICLFESGISIRATANQMKINYKTMFKIYSVIRQAIFEEYQKSTPYLGEISPSMQGGTHSGESPIFCVVRKNGVVNLGVNPKLDMQTLLKNNVAMAKRGPLIFTERCGDCDTLIFLESKKIPLRHRIGAKKKITISDGVNEFISFMTEKMIHYPHISPDNFVYYLVEMEWRFNNRGKNISHLIMEYLSRDLNRGNR